MKLIDVTFDLESLSLASNAAVLQIAAVAFDRYAIDGEELFPKSLPDFEAKVDIRSCVMDGFDFSPATVKWWSEKPQEVKNEVLSGDCYPLPDVVGSFCEWLTDIQTLTKADIVLLWAQGSDFDISVLRTILRTYGMEKKFPIPYHNFRDARTFIAEIGSRFALTGHEGLADHSKIYASLPSYPEEGNVHSATYDCRRTSWSLWHCFSLMPDPS